MRLWTLRHPAVSDPEVEQRIREKLRMLVRYPDAIRVSVDGGTVTLEGPVLSDEVEYLLRLLRRITGVRTIVNRLAVHDDAERAPELKPLLRWAPSTRQAGPGAALAPPQCMTAVGLMSVKGLTHTERMRLLELRKKAQRITEELTRGRRPRDTDIQEYGRKEYPMALVRDVMTPQVEVISPDATAEEAADRMKQLNIGVIPVCDEQGLIGMVTDRDLVVRVMGSRRDPKGVLVGEVMTPDLVYGFDDQDVQEAAMLMADKQIRRLPVLNRERHLVGILSLGDIAVHGQDQHLSGEVLEDVSQPSQPNR
ncbi:MAG TPA: CBS domain-containing protein [Nitrospira sp.]|nr:CBS domain-containing protein [Nitrospira sp.]